MFKKLKLTIMLLAVLSLVSAFTYNFFSKRVVTEYVCSDRYLQPYDQVTPMPITIKVTRFGPLAFDILWHRSAFVEIRVLQKNGEITRYDGSASFENRGTVEVVGSVLKNKKEINFSFVITAGGYEIFEGSSGLLKEQKETSAGKCEVRKYWHAQPNTPY